MGGEQGSRSEQKSSCKAGLTTASGNLLGSLELTWPVRVFLRWAIIGFPRKGMALGKVAVCSKGDA